MYYLRFGGHRNMHASFFPPVTVFLEVHKIRYLTHPNTFHLGNKVVFFLWGLYIILLYYTRFCSSSRALPQRTETNNCTPQGQGVSRMHAKCCIFVMIGTNILHFALKFGRKLITENKCLRLGNCNVEKKQTNMETKWLM